MSTGENITAQAENYIEDTILANQPKAKKIEAQNAPNWDLTLIFKVGRKKERIELANLDYEMAMVPVSEKYAERLREFNTKCDEAVAGLREEYKEDLEGYNTEMRAVAKDFVVKGINDYFKLEEELGLEDNK